MLTSLQLYASAIMAKLDGDFLQTYKSHIDSIYFDVAHDANYDSRRRGEGELMIVTIRQIMAPETFE